MLLSRALRDASRSTAGLRRRALYFSIIWPEPTSSAGSMRVMMILRALQRAGWHVTLASPARPNAHMESLRRDGVSVAPCPPNDEEALRRLVRASQPDVVLFNGFATEEMFGHAAKLALGRDEDDEHRSTSNTDDTSAAEPSLDAGSVEWDLRAPLAVLDTQDLHSLRLARQEVVERWTKDTRPPAGANVSTEFAPAFTSASSTPSTTACTIPSSTPSTASSTPSATTSSTASSAASTTPHIGAVRADSGTAPPPSVSDAEWLDRVMAVKPRATHAGWVRELSSIHRSDRVWVVSPWEKRLLERECAVPPWKLAVIPFAFTDQEGLEVDADGERVEKGDWPDAGGEEGAARCVAPSSVRPALLRVRPFHRRAHFVTIGNFRHPPNRDSVQWLARSVWPAVRARLPHAELHVYGAYPTREDMALHDPATGFHVRGPAKSVDVVGKYRVLLSPLRFGAGIKGKIAEAWARGTPVVTTPVGAEGMFPVREVDNDGEDGGDDRGRPCRPPGYGPEQWPPERGVWGGEGRARSVEEIVEACVALHEDRVAWQASAEAGRALCRSLFDASEVDARIARDLDVGWSERSMRRERDFARAVLGRASEQVGLLRAKYLATKGKVGV